MIIVIPLLLALAVSTLAANVHRRPPRAEHAIRQENNPDPAVGGSPDGGWQSMPQVTDATAYPNWTLNDSGAMLVGPLPLPRIVYFLTYRSLSIKQLG